jgi:ParB family chromosome partitioning protein
VRAVEDAVRAHGAEPEKSSEGRRGTPATGQLRAPGLLELEELLGDYLDTRVKVAIGGKQGKVTIDFADLEDLERIYRLITEGRPARRKKTG